LGSSGYQPTIPITHSHSLYLYIINILKMKFAFGIVSLLAVGASAFAPLQASARSSSLSSTASKSDVYTFAKSEEIFAEAKEVGTLFVVVAMNLLMELGDSLITRFLL
jgi:hypothetical protein